MATYYIIENDKIVNAIVADTKEIAELVTGLSAIDAQNATVKDATIGATLDKTSGIYVNPLIETE